MATLKEAIESGRAFHWGTTDKWYKFNCGRLVCINGGEDIYQIPTDWAIGDKWVIRSANVTWYRPELAWSKSKRRYLEVRTWFRECQRHMVHPDLIVVKWEEREMPEL